MQKVRKSRLSKRIKQAAAFAMGLILMAGSLSLDCHVAAAETKGTEVDGFTETQARGVLLIPLISRTRLQRYMIFSREQVQ